MLLHLSRDQTETDICKHCLDEIDWDWKDPNDHSIGKWPFQAKTDKLPRYCVVDEYGNPLRHFCRPCGATGWDREKDMPTPGCGKRIVQRWRLGRDGKARPFMVLAGSKEQTEHDCKWMREARLEGLRRRKRLQNQNWAVTSETDPEDMMPPSEAEEEEDEEPDQAETEEPITEGLATFTPEEIGPTSKEKDEELQEQIDSLRSIMNETTAGLNDFSTRLGKIEDWLKRLRGD